MKIKAALIPLLALGMVAGCSDSAPLAQDSYIEVQGEGSIDAVADRFQIQATATADGKDVSALKTAVDTQINEAVRLIKALGIDDKDIHALSVQVQPQWEWQPKRRMIGYQVRRQITLSVNGLETYGEALQILTDSGISEVNPGGSSVSNEEELADQALALAILDAQRKAEILAESAGRDVGDALVIVETGGSSPRPMVMHMEAASAKADAYYSAGTSTITRQVQVRFELD